MITVEDKISTFSKYVYDKEFRLSNQVLQQLEDQNKKSLQAKQEEIERKCSNLEKKMNKKMEMESQKIISNAKLEAKNKFLNTKKELLDQFIQEILNSFQDFTKTEEYRRYIKKTLERAKDFLKKDTIKVYLVKKDIEKFASEIKLEYPNVEIVEMEDENIGGMILESISDNERIDFTFRRKVNDWKNEIGLRLYEALEK